MNGPAQRTAPGKMPGKISDGFTLLEVQLALLILALILTLAFSSLYLLSKGWQASEQLAARNDELRTTGRLLRRYIGQAAPLLWQQKPQEPRLIFEGESDRLRFVTALPGGLQVLFLKVRAGEQPGERSYLGLGYLPLRPEHSPFQAEPEQEASWLRLVENVDQITLAYYGEDDTPGPVDWVSHWRKQAQLPQLVRLRLQSEHAVPWPELVLAVRTELLDHTPQLHVYAEQR